MDRRHAVVWAMLVLMLLSTTWALAQSGEEWTIGRWDTPGGGGTSSGGGFLVRGSVGQPEANGLLKGGAFAVRGGFWTGGDKAVATPTPTHPSAPGVSPLKLPYLLHNK